MSFIYNRTELLKGISFNTIIDKKFKTNTISFKIITPLDIEYCTLNSLSISNICCTNANYRTISQMGKKLNELYGATLGYNTSKHGDTQILSAVVRFIDDKFTFNGENITKEVLTLFLDCLFNPNLENHGFNHEIFKIKQNSLLDAIETEINNKRDYAMIQSQKVIFRDEPKSISPYGDKEHTLLATPKKVYERYLELLRTSKIEIFYVGSSEKPIILDEFKKALSKIDRSSEIVPTDTKPSIIKSQVEEVIEEMEDITQVKMVIALKTSIDSKYPTIVMNTILGQSPFSKLFANVREKLSLCYTCQSMYDHLKRTITIDSGIEINNIEKAKKSILEQIEDIKNGNFTDDDLKNTISYLCNSLKSVGDSPSSYINWYLINGANTSIEEKYKQYQEVTREQVIESAKALTLDTIYVLKPSNK